MSNSSRCRILALLVFMSALYVVWGTVSNSPVFQVETEIRTQSETKIILALTVKNTGSNDILIAEGYLPWDRYAMTLVLVETKPPGTPLEQELQIADPIPGEPWRLRAGKSIGGTIDLTDRFPQLAEVLKRKEVLVFWSYKCEGGTGTGSERISGWELIPKLPKQPHDHLRSADNPKSQR